MAFRKDFYDIIGQIGYLSKITRLLNKMTIGISDKVGVEKQTINVTINFLYVSI